MADEAARVAHEEYKGHPLIAIYNGERRAISFGRRKAQLILAAMDGIKSFAKGELEASADAPKAEEPSSSAYVGKGDRGHFLEVKIEGGAPLRFAEEKARALVALEGDLRNFCEGKPLEHTEGKNLGEFWSSLEEYKGNPLIEIHGNWNKRFTFGKRKAQTLLNSIEAIAQFSRGEFDKLPEVVAQEEGSANFRIDEGRGGKAVFELEVPGGAPMRFQQPKAELIVQFEDEIQQFAKS